MQKTTQAGVDRSIPDSSLVALRNTIHGDLIRPGDGAYDEARSVWNGAIDRKPAAIIQCAGASDAQRAVQFAREHELPLAVRSGGHSIFGHGVCANGIVIDLKRMKDIQMDARNGTARTSAGLTCGELLSETSKHGMFVPLGMAASIGISGLTLGGGLGPVSAKFGLACDSLIGADVVTADGRIVRASELENPGLFWALRGGGGNFGVVTSLEFRLSRLQQVVGGALIHPIERASDVLRFYRDYSGQSPDELSVSVVFATSPNGHPIIALVACYAAAPGEAEPALRPLRAFGPPVADFMRPMSVAEAHALDDGFSARGRRYCLDGCALADLPDGALDIIARFGSARISPWSVVVVRDFHGAAARVPADATAFALRPDHYILEIIGQWSDGPGLEHSTWVRDFCAEIRPFALQGVDINFLGRDSSSDIRASSGPNYERLTKVKRQWDPENLFRMNPNIPPAQ
jgi:FAD/FMN-containing dehydrogenase